MYIVLIILVDKSFIIEMYFRNKENIIIIIIDIRDNKQKQIFIFMN